jgi:hypothetical protein
MGDLRGIRMTFDVSSHSPGQMALRTRPGVDIRNRLLLSKWMGVAHDRSNIPQTQFLNALATRAEATKSAVVAIRLRTGDKPYRASIKR